MGDFEKWRSRSSLSLSSFPPLSPPSSSPSPSHSDSSRPTRPITRDGFSRLSLSFSSPLFLILLLLLSISVAMVAPTASQAPGSPAGDGDSDGDGNGNINGIGDCGLSNLTGYLCAKSVPVKNNNNLRGEFTVKLSEVLTAAPSRGASAPEHPVLLSNALASSPRPNVADTSAAVRVLNASPLGPGGVNTSSASTSCSPSNLPGLACSMDLQGGPSLHWNPRTPNGGMEIALQIEGRKVWASVGWTEDGRMRGDAVIAGKDPNVGVYRIESDDASTITPSTRFNVSNASWNITDTSTILRFTRQEDDGSVPPNQQGVQLMWAHALPDATVFDYHVNHKGAISQPFWKRVLAANSIGVSSAPSVSLPGGQTFEWSRVPNVGGGVNAQEMVTMTYRVPGEVAWLSVGWNENGKMTGNAVIGMAGGNVTTHKLIDKSKAGVVPTQDFIIFNPFFNSSGDATVLRFSRYIDGVDLKVSGSTGMTWAHARPGIAGFEYHGNNKGSMKIDLALGQGTASGSKSNSYYYAHAWLMWITFGVLLPAAIFLARYGKRWDPMWFNAHVALQLLAVGAATAGFIIAVIKFDSLDELHGRLGVAVMLLVWMQPVIGLARPHKGTQQRVPWYFLHWLLGTSAAFLGLLNIFYGIRLLDPITGVPKVVKVLFSVEFIAVLIAYLLLNELPYILSQRQTPVQKLSRQNVVMLSRQNLAMTTPTE